MTVWVISAGISLALVLICALLEWQFLTMERLPRPPKPDLVNVAAKVLLFMALTAALHAAIDPDHDQNRFQLHVSQIARGVYAFAGALALIVAFPNLRIAAAAILMCGAITVMELLQWGGVLPGRFHWLDWASGICGVAAAVGPVWLGARRAKVNFRKGELHD